MEPASSIVKKLGGTSKVAEIVSRHPTRVSNWKRPRSVGGTGGQIPQSLHRTILRAAEQLGVPISAEDLLPYESNDLGGDQ